MKKIKIVLSILQIVFLIAIILLVALFLLGEIENQLFYIPLIGTFIISFINLFIETKNKKSQEIS